MEGTSIDPTNEKLKQLQQLFPEAFTEGNVDWEKLKATLGEDINFANERYVLNWAGKSNAFKEIKTPTTKTLIPCKEESEDWDNTEHIFIEGENLDVLRALQKSYHNKVKMIYIDPPYNTGKDSFVYPDKFSETKDEYQKRVGDKDEEGYLVNDCHFSTNSKENGQYHSNWLNMMYPRLHLARNLLKEDGVIFVSIDENEVHNLRLMMNEIFGEENFISNLSIINNLKGRSDDDFFATCNEFCLVFSKSKSIAKITGFPLEEEELEADYNLNDDISSYKLIGLRKTGKGWERIHRPYMYYPVFLKDKEFSTISKDDFKKIYNSSDKSFDDKFVEELTGKYKDNGFSVYLPMDSSGNKGRWRWGYDRFLIEKEVNVDINENGSICSKMRSILSDGSIRLKSAKSLWYKPEYDTGSSSRLLKKLFNIKSDIFDNPKSIYYIKDILKISVASNDIILDFFSGSGTTAHAIMALNTEDGGNRQCISVQLAEETDKTSVAFKEGYKHIADISKERIKRAAKQIKEDNHDYDGDLGMKVFKLQESNFKQWRQLNTIDADELAKQIKMFVDPVSEDAINENMLYELLLKSGKDLNSSVVLKDKVYYINDNELVILLDEVSQDIIDTVISETPNKVLVLDKLFSGNDKLKTNTKLQMDDAGIKFKTI